MNFELGFTKGKVASFMYGGNGWGIDTLGRFSAILGQVAQSIVSLTSSIVAKMLNCYSKYNI